MQANLLFGSHDILVAWSENLIYLRYRLCAVGHCSDGLHATSLENLVHTCNTGCHENSGVHLTFAVGRRTQYDILAACNLCWSGQHQNSREEWGCASWDIETNLLDSDTFLPAGHASTGLHLLSSETL